MYFYVHNLQCEDISMELTLWDTAGFDDINQWKFHYQSQLECVKNEFTGAIHLTPSFDF